MGNRWQNIGEYDRGMRWRIFLCWIIGLLYGISDTPTLLWAQQGMRFAELKQRLLPYFAEEMIWDIHKQLPQREDYRIWGWDVGDFSGDRYPDVAISIKRASQKKKIAEVLLFVDIDGFLVEVGQFQKPYTQLPIEVGVAIKDTTCYIVSRQSSAYWQVSGYRFLHGTLITVMQMSSRERKGEIYRYREDFTHLRIQEQWFHQRTGALKKEVLTVVVPVHRRFRVIPLGVPQMPEIASVRFVPKGAFYWRGAEDASFRLKVAYNQRFLYVLVDVRDDTVVTERKPQSLADHVALWFDMQSVREVEPGEPIRTVPLKNGSDSGLMVIELFPGDFKQLKPSVRVQSTEDLDSLQRQALDQIRIVARPTNQGYQLKVRIPFQLLGFWAAPLRPQKLTLLRAAVAVYDVDNRFRPEEETMIVSSTHFDPFNSATYSLFCLIPETAQYGSFRNIYLDQLVARLNELGF